MARSRRLRRRSSWRDNCANEQRTLTPRRSGVGAGAHRTHFERDFDLELKNEFKYQAGGPGGDKWVRHDAEILGEVNARNAVRSLAPLIN